LTKIANLWEEFVVQDIWSCFISFQRSGYDWMFVLTLPIDFAGIRSSWWNINSSMHNLL